MCEPPITDLELYASYIRDRVLRDFERFEESLDFDVGERGLNVEYPK